MYYRLTDFHPSPLAFAEEFETDALPVLDSEGRPRSLLSSLRTLPVSELHVLQNELGAQSPLEVLVLACRTNTVAGSNPLVVWLSDDHCLEVWH